MSIFRSFRARFAVFAASAALVAFAVAPVTAHVQQGGETPGFSGADVMATHHQGSNDQSGPDEQGDVQTEQSGTDEQGARQNDQSGPDQQGDVQTEQSGTDQQGAAQSND